MKEKVRYKKREIEQYLFSGYVQDETIELLTFDSFKSKLRVDITEEPVYFHGIEVENDFYIDISFNLFGVKKNTQIYLDGNVNKIGSIQYLHSKLKILYAEYCIDFAKIQNKKGVN
jgi:hypothetical protein